MTILQVVGRKVVVLENPFRLDVVGFQDVTQEDRDVVRVVAREVLAALDGRATRGAGLGANKVAIIATGWAMSSRLNRELFKGRRSLEPVGSRTDTVARGNVGVLVG